MGTNSKCSKHGSLTWATQKSCASFLLEIKSTSQGAILVGKKLQEKKFNLSLHEIPSTIIIHINSVENIQ
jgi:hypothetical protein